MTNMILANLLDAAYATAIGPRAFKLNWPGLLIDAARVVVATDGVDLPEAKDERARLVPVLREYVKLAYDAGYDTIAIYIDAAADGIGEGLKQL